MKTRRTNRGHVRIIGGEWRSRRLKVADVPGLRPTGDRVRETLFNWLQPHVQGAVCADLFAGTGALGLEAASRGAASVSLIEKSHAAVRALRDNVEALRAGNVTVAESDALAWIARCPKKSLDIVFVDPPFAEGLQQAALSLLAESDCLESGALVYVESARQEPAIASPQGWLESKEKTVGEVRMQLFKKL